MTGGSNAFLLSSGCGAAILLLWDMLSGMRRSFARGVVINALLDVAWWLLSVSAFLWCVWRAPVPEPRLFEGVGLILGACLYKITISRYIKGFFLCFFRAAEKIIRFIFKILLTPMTFLYTITYKCIYYRLGKRY